MELDGPIVLQVYHDAQKSFYSGDLAKTEGILQALFTDTTSALTAHAEFFSHCRELKSNKSLALFHAKNIEKWLAAQEKAGKSLPNVDKELKLSVMPIIASCHSSTGNILIKVFRLNQPPNEFLKQFVSDLIAQERLKEAISVTCKLAMQDHFDLFDMALPMLAQNKLNLVEEYLSGCKVQQIECVKMIDSWLRIDFDIIEFFQEKNIFHIRGELLRPKFVVKLLTRWLRIFFDINDTYSDAGRKLCPNLCKQKSLNNLRYLLYRHYVEELSSVETTQELIMKSVGEDKWLQEQVVDILRTVHGDWDSARQWANLYGIEHESINQSCNTRFKNKILEAQESDWDCVAVENDNEQPKTNFAQGFLDQRKHADPARWYDLRLSLDNIHFVGSLESLKQSTESILKNDIVGVDSEWVPDFARKGDVSVSLLQIASFDAVHLIDVSFFCSSGQDNKDAFCDLLKRLFLTKDILKIGFGIGEDLRKLTAAVVGLDIEFKNTARVVDLCTAVRHLERLYPRLFDIPDKTRSAADLDTSCSINESGLSKLVHRCLGKPLNKCEQLSDWERRPLRQSQLIYASIDAFVLLELWSFIHNRLKMAGIKDTLETIKNVQSAKAISKVAISKGDGTELHSANDVFHEEKKKLPNEFKVVCDNMLQGLGRQLRCCGVDVRILSNFEDHDTAAEIAVKENRVILTSGTPFQSLSSQVKIGNCFNVPCGEKARDQAAFVLQHYNVKVTAQDIFSRCQLCNGNKYLKVLPHVMRQCIKKKKHRCQQSIGKSNDTMHEFGLPSSRVTNSYFVGRARHVHEQYKAPGSTKFSYGIGRGRAWKKNHSTEVDVLKPVNNLSAEVNKKLKIENSNTETNVTTYRECSDEYDDEDDDGLLMVCSPAPEVCLSSQDFLPINSGNTGSNIQHGYTGSYQFMLSDDEEPCRSNSNSQIAAAEISTGIMESEQKQSTSVWPSFTTEKCKDGILPFIINPNSLCTQGYINLENITIVTSDNVEGRGTSIDCTVTPLQCEQVPHNMLDRVKEFYCCIKCGKVFWEGRHFSHVLQQFSNIISKD